MTLWISLKKDFKKNKEKSYMTVIYVILAALIIAADRLSKIFTVSAAEVGGKFGEIPYLADFIYVKNTGAAFSMFSGKVSALSVISALFCIGVIVYFIVKKPKSKLMCTALALLFSGAAGNAIDRIANGYVVDFISLKFINFPVFNIADIAITVGAALLVIYMIFFDREQS